MIGASVKRLAAAQSVPHAYFFSNIGWNLAGQIVPVLAALIAIPVLIEGIGVDRFGLLTIAWMLIGYFSLFDLGIGRAMTQLISEKMGRNEHDALPQLIWTGLLTMTGLGLIATMCIVALSHWTIYSGLNVPADLRSEAQLSLYMLAPAVPLVVVATGLRGILEAQQKFKAANLVRLPIGVLMFVGPLCVLPWTNSLVPIFGVLLVLRLGAVVALYWVCRKSLGNFRHIVFSKKILPELLRFGGWMTVSNVISPIMVQMDRLMIGGMLSLAAVAYYATPLEIVTKILLVPAAVAGVAFPTFARLHAQRNTEAADKLYWRSIKLISMAIMPVLLLLGVFADEVLQVWLHSAFPVQSAAVLRILCAGVLINGLAHIPFAYLQGAKRANVTAKIHLAELPFYLIALYFSVSYFGIVGAASAWTLRVAIDAVVMHCSANSLRSSYSAMPAKD